MCTKKVSKVIFLFHDDFNHIQYHCQNYRLLYTAIQVF